MLHGDAGIGAVPVRDRRPAGLRRRATSAWSRSTSTARASASGASCASSSGAACRSPSSASAWRWSATPRSPPPSSSCGHEIACHGWRWINYQQRRRGDRARAHATSAIEAHRASSPASAPLGWYTGRDSPNTRRLVVDARRLRVRQRLLRRRPAVLDCRSQRATARARRTSSCPTRSTPTTCASRCRRASTPASTSSPTCATASTCSTPKATSAPKMMSVGMHCRLLGRPGRIARAAALPRPRRSARPRLGVPPHRHRAALEARRIRSTRAGAFVWQADP